MYQAEINTVLYKYDYEFLPLLTAIFTYKNKY